MEQKFIKYICELSKNLIERYGFKIKTELNDGQSYMIEYSSENFEIRIEKYFREFYVSLYELNNPDNGIELFNLLEYLNYLNPGAANVPEEECFLKEKDLDECYKKQFRHISTVIYDNYNVINDFFSGENVDAKFADLRKYRRDKYPELYRRHKD